MTPKPPALSAAAWTEIKALFEALAALPAAQRAELRARHRLDAAAQDELDSLLAHHDAVASTTGGFMDMPAKPGEAGAGGPALAASVVPGQRLGPWEIVRAIGQGGMGEVFEARRADGLYDGRAAVKLLRRGMDSMAVLERFSLERRALARLSHPHIARLLDAGASADGLPYFVMEFVDGVAIDVAANGLGLRDRVLLFLQLADAVAHAHRQLLVHRDLKPGNVLVDRQGQVKLLDFGIAKALDPLETPSLHGERADETVGGVRPYTPHYASPEQVRGEPVSTATDVYSLGVLLYQLLTGVRPTGRSARTPAEAARGVLEDTPTRPSRLSATDHPDPQWPAHRRKFEGDLDNILLKALEKAPEQRYASVDAFAADLRANLSGYPVSARPPRPLYLARRFLGRHRVASAATAMAVVAVLGGAAAAWWQGRLAQEQRVLAERRFDEVRRFARTMLFEVDTALRDGPTAGREKLVSTTLVYLDRLAAERSTDTALLNDVAEAYERVGEILGGNSNANLGRPTEARQSQDKALALRQRLFAADPTNATNLEGLARSHERLGDLSRGQRKLDEAAEHYGQAVRHLATLSAARPDDLKLQLRRVETQRYLASVWYWPFNPSLGRHAQARPAVEALVRDMAAIAVRHPDVPEVLAQQGALLNQWSEFQRISGEFGPALATQRQSHAVATRLLALAPANPRWQRWMYLAEGYLADALMGTGDFDTGLAMWRASIARREALARADPKDERSQRNLANGYGPLAEAFEALGRQEEALAWYQRENALLREQRALHPEVMALVGRLDESDRDLARQWVQVGRVAEGVALQHTLDGRRGEQAAAALTTPDGARFALLRARVLLAPGAPALDAERRLALLAQARAALALLRTEAAREPFNVVLAREAAAGAHTLALTLAPQGAAGVGVVAAETCTLLREANAAFGVLADAGRMPAMVRWQPADAKRRAADCGAGG